MEHASTPSAPRRIVWRDELALIVGLAALVLLVSAYFAPRGFRAGFTDMAHDGYQLRQVIDLDRGGTIFKDTFDQYGSLSGYLNLAGFRLLGRTLLAMKYALAFWYAATAVLLYLLARYLLSPGLSVASVLIWIALAPFYRHGLMISPHAYVLFLQAAAMLAVIRFSERDHVRWLALAGVCCGLCWALKSSMGMLFGAAALSYIFSRPLRGASTTRRALTAATIFILGASLVVAVTFLWLWRRGALHDWYLQTIVFPKLFYVDQRTADSSVTGSAFAFMLNFLQVNFDMTSVPVALYWHLIRVVVVSSAVVLWRRRAAPEALLVAAFATPFLWLGAYPSANYMHQWWTASLSIPAFVYCVNGAIGLAAHRWTTMGPRYLGWATVGLLAIVMWSGIVDRLDAIREKTGTLTETIESPRVISGMRTDPRTLAGFRMLYDAMVNFKQHHPSTRIVSVDHCDGYSNCVAESLLWLSFFEDNAHDQPVYWPLPVLSTSVYPDYQRRFWEDVRRTRPLIVDNWNGGFRSYNTLSGYELLVGVRTETGFWYVFAPVHAESVAHGEVPVRLEGPAAPSTVKQERTASEGAPPAPPVDHADAELQVPVAGVQYGSVTFVEPETGQARDVRLHLWPSDAGIPDPVLPRRPLDVRQAVERAPNVTVDAGRWLVRGTVESRYSYLLQFPERPIEKGDYFVAAGSLEEGGVTFGLLRNGRWAGYVNVETPGPFGVVLRPPGAGRYTLVLANSVHTNWSRFVRRHGARGLVGLATGDWPPNVLSVDRAGWVTSKPEPPAAMASAVPANARMYTWPPDFSVPAAPPPRPLDMTKASWRAAIISAEGGRWLVRGSADARYSYLLEFKDQPVDPGAYFLATGNLEEGGFTFGLLRDGAWVGYVNVETPGPFGVVLRPPGAERYTLVLANCVNTTWAQVIRRNRGRGLLSLMLGAWRPNVFRVDQAGWVTPPAMAAASQ
jgi:hypothetical protein